MVSPRRQGHIVATLPKKGIRQVQEYDVKQLPSISPPPRTANQYLAADSAAQDDGEGELKGSPMGLVSTPRGASLRQPEIYVTR